MTGETDLELMLSSIAVVRRPGSFCFLANVDDMVESAAATVREEEGLTVVVTVDVARDRGFEPDFVAAWLTLRVHSALQAVGLTAAVSRALADEGIPCNIIAGYQHDHLFVPVDRAESAIAAIEALASPNSD